MRNIICDYVLRDYPETLYSRWFKSISAAKRFANSLADAVYINVHRYH